MKQDSKIKKSPTVVMDTSTDVDVIVGVVVNNITQVTSDSGVSWTGRSADLLRGVVQYLCWANAMGKGDLSLASIVKHLDLSVIEDMYIRGYDEARSCGEWPYGYNGIKSYLEVYLPGYDLEKLMIKGGYTRREPSNWRDSVQEDVVIRQHDYRVAPLLHAIEMLNKVFVRLAPVRRNTPVKAIKKKTARNSK